MLAIPARTRVPPNRWAFPTTRMKRSAPSSFRDRAAANGGAVAVYLGLHRRDRVRAQYEMTTLAIGDARRMGRCSVRCRAVAGAFRRQRGAVGGIIAKSISPPVGVIVLLAVLSRRRTWSISASRWAVCRAGRPCAGARSSARYRRHDRRKPFSPLIRYRRVLPAGLRSNPSE